MPVNTLKKILPVILLAAVLMPSVSFGAENCKDIIQTFDACVNKAFQSIAQAIGQLISYVGAFLISIAATLIQVLISLSTKVGSSFVVQEGFKITLNIANLGFVLAIIIIAFITMLRLQGYETKKMLRNLILAAVLINFSFAITGVISDLFNLLANYFIGASVGNLSSLENYASNLANALNVQKFVTVETNFFGEGLLALAGGFLKLIASIAAVAIFNTVIVITFFAIVFFLLVRYVVLSILLIVMPIVWLLWIFPKLDEHWKKWWSEFLKWNFFLPAIAFFLYLSMATSQKVGEVIKQTAGKTAPLQAAEGLSVLAATTITDILQAMVQVFLVFGGLYAATKVGITGASVAMNMATGAKNWIIGAAGKIATKPARVAGTGAANWALKKGGVAEKFAGGLSKIPFLKGAAAGLYNLAASRQAAVETRQKEEFSKDSDGAILAKFNTFTTDKVRKAALANEITKRGLIEKVDKKRLDDYLTSAKEMGATKDILENAPFLAPKVMDFDKVFKKAVERKVAKEGEEKVFKETLFEEFATQLAMEDFKPSKTDQLKPADIEKVAKYFGQGHRERLAKEGDTSQLLAVAKAAEKIRQTGDATHELVKFAMQNPAMQRVTRAPEYEKEIATLVQDIKAAEKATKEAAKAQEEAAKAEITRKQKEAERGAGGRRQRTPTIQTKPVTPPSPPTPPQTP